MVGCPEIADHLLGPANDHRKSQRQYEVQLDAAFMLFINWGAITTTAS